MTLFADSNIGNGKLFVCSDGAIISVKRGTEFTKSRAIAKFKRIIKRKRALIASLPKGSKRRSKAIAAKKNARQGIADVRACEENGGGVDLYDGTWNLVTENGMTPAENGFTSLTLTFSSTTFTSDYTSDSLNCHWAGTYSKSSNPVTTTLLTTSATGGGSCDSAVNQERTAATSFTDNGNTLTLDYRPEGALQVYERVLN
jgi:hypothetical protein